MTTYLLLHGGGCDGWYWSPLIGELEARGHAAVAPDLPIGDPSAGLRDYAAAAAAAVDETPEELIVVGHSFGGLAVPLVAAHVPVALLVFLTGMVPRPGETPGAWWNATGHEVETPDDEDATYYHDVPAELADAARAHERAHAAEVMDDPFPADGWPQVPVRFLLCRDDRFFPADWMRGVVRERLGIEPDEIDGGHMVMLSRPRELADRLEAIRRDALAGERS